MNIIFNSINLNFIFFYQILQKFGCKIFYIYENKKINKEKKNINNKFGINQINLSRIPNINTVDWKNYWINQQNYINKISEKNFSNSLKEILIRKLKIKNYEALNLFLFENTFSNSLNKSEVIKIFSKYKGLSIFVSFSLNDYFIEKSNYFKKIIFPINIFWFILIIKKILEVVFIVIFKRFRKPKVKISYANDHQDKSKIKLLYILHGGVKSVNNFKNIILDFKNDKKNLFNKDEVLIFEYTNYKEKILNFNIVYYSELVLNKKILFDSLKILAALFVRIRSIKDFFLILKINNSIIGFLKFNNFLNSYPNIKVAFIDYDFLCPKFLIFSLNLKNINTFSYQERPLTVFYNNISFIYDYYFTISSFFSNKIKIKNNFLLNKTIDCGFYDLENYYSTNIKLTNNNNILFLNFKSASDQFSRLNDLAISDRSHKKFLYDFIRIVQKFPSIQFSISSKDIFYFEDKTFQVFFNKINKFKNAKIISLNETLTTFDLIQKNDLIIGKPSSIMEKCLYIKKPILIHDYTNNISNQMSKVMEIYDGFFYCNSFDDLYNKICIFINKKNFFNEKLSKENKKLFNRFYRTSDIIHENIFKLL